jgi:hypothetical protein
MTKEGTPFVVPNDPGARVSYLQWAAPTTIKMNNMTFLLQQELLLVLQKHCMGMLWHIQCKHCCAIQSVQYPISDWVEFDNDHHQDP